MLSVKLRWDPQESLTRLAIGRIKLPEEEWLYDVHISQKDFQTCKEKSLISFIKSLLGYVRPLI